MPPHSLDGSRACKVRSLPPSRIIGGEEVAGVRLADEAGQNRREAVAARTLRYPGQWTAVPLPGGLPMPHADDAPHEDDRDSRDQLHHDLMGSLATISGRAQLLTRFVRRSSTLADGDRERLVHGLAAIEAEVTVMVARLDTLSRLPREDGQRGE